MTVEEHQQVDSKFTRLGAIVLLVLLFGISQLWNGIASTLIYGDDSLNKINKTTSIQDTEAINKCINILAIGASVTAGSAGFHGAHPDAPELWKDPWPAKLEEALNLNFPCSNSTNNNTHGHRVVNKASGGCAASCHLQKWPESYGDYVGTNWDLIILEHTSGGSNGRDMLIDRDNIHALVASLSNLPTSKEAGIILLSATFRLIGPNPHTRRLH